MADSAAFFDLDRTLLLGASGPVISAGLRERGLLGPQPIPGERLAFSLFKVLGENLPSILLSRQGTRAARGWPVETVRRVATDVAGPLVDLVQPFARQAIEEHRGEGRRLVLATTSPRDLVAPFAKRLGFDEVLATRYRIADQPGPDGPMYDGTIDGEFVWSSGKARSVAVWARANLIELADSYAYSDSIFDVPLLSMVGYPVAVNPDPRLLIYATAKGWPRRWFNAPAGVPKPVGVEPQQVVASLARPGLFPWVDIEIRGADHLPADGPTLLAANHRSYLDPLVVAYAAARRGRPVRFLAKKELTDASVVGPVVRAMGVIRVDRGSGDDGPMLDASRALAAGELVAIFPQGTIPRGPEFDNAVLTGRTGAVRLAMETGAPIVPVGIWGSELAWPRNSKVPYVLNLADPPKVTLTIGEPYHPTGEDRGAATADLMARVADLLPAEARSRA